VRVSRWPCTTVRVVGLLKGGTSISWRRPVVAARVQPWFFFAKAWGVESASRFGWRLARCWVLRGRAFRLFFSDRSHTFGVGWGGGGFWASLHLEPSGRLALVGG
jgi:hypothetical protein